MTTTISTDCGCGSAGGTIGQTIGTGVTSVGERTRFYPRQIVQAPDLTQDQLYFREKLRRHNRLLHGWGIVCGVRVRVGTKPGTVLVEPGSVLGPFGDEIVVGDVVEVDLAAQDLDGDATNGCAEPDPWCADVRVPRPEGKPVYLAISYAEYACRPVGVAASACGCGCGGEECEYSRIRDSWRIRVLDALPSTYSDVLVGPPVQTAVACAPRPIQLDPAGHPVPFPVGTTDCNCPTCAPCATDPWVVLADITLKGGVVSKLDSDAHRRYVASFRDYFYTCGSGFQVSPALIGLFRGDAVSRLKAAVDPKLAVAQEPAAGLLLSHDWTPGLTARVKSMTVDQVRSQTREDFVASLAGDLHGAPAEDMAGRLQELWDRATDAWTIANA